MQPEFEEPMVEAAAIFETFQSDPFASGRWVKSTKAKYAEQAVEIGQGAKGSALEGDQVRAGVPLLPGPRPLTHRATAAARRRWC